MNDAMDRLTDLSQYHRAIADAAEEVWNAALWLEEDDTRIAVGHLLEAAGHMIGDDVLRAGLRAITTLHYIPTTGNTFVRPEHAAAMEALQAVLDCEREEKPGSDIT